MAREYEDALAGKCIGDDMGNLGVDVSAYQGMIDWKKVKMAGFDFAILKIIRKDLTLDKQFERNYLAAEAAGVIVKGVYNYSYATGIDKAKRDAKAVIKALNGRKTMVWLDVEDKCQMGLGIILINIIKTYQEEIEKEGLSFGVYTGLAFYNSYIKKYKDKLSCPFWIARYGKNNGALNAVYQPCVDNMVAWQYTSKGKVNGIKGDVDLNVYYGQNVEKQIFSNPYPAPKRTLYAKKVLGRWVCRGEDVKYVQYSLMKQGIISDKEIDGIYGSCTAESVKRLQRLKGISQDGITGEETRQYL